MKKISIVAIVVLLLLTSSCGTYHYKGDYSSSSWDKKDVQFAENEMNSIKKEILKTFSKKDTKLFFDCYLENVIRAYPNFQTADKDESGCEQLAIKCVKDLGLVAK